MIGIPTLNIELSAAPETLDHGVYACLISFEGAQHQGAMHFGPRPVFKDTDTLEVHVLDTTIATAPKTVDIEVIAKLRAIRKFSSVEALKQGIQGDIDATRAILGA